VNKYDFDGRMAIVTGGAQGIGHVVDKSILATSAKPLGIRLYSSNALVFRLRVDSSSAPPSI